VVGIDAILLDPHIEDECTAGHLLAVAAVAGVHDQWRRRHAIPHCTAGAPSFQIHLHPPRSTLNADLAVVAVLCSKKQPAPVSRTSENLDFCRPAAA
jgi:molybdenum cofactor biosynthesis enzyme